MKMEIREQGTGKLLGKLKFSDEQSDLIEKAAQQCNQEPGDFVRGVILEKVKNIVDKK